VRRSALDLEEWTFMTKDEMLTPREVSEYLKVPIQTVWRWCRIGTLPAVKIGKYWRIPGDDLEASLEAKANRHSAEAPLGASEGLTTKSQQKPGEAGG